MTILSADTLSITRPYSNSLSTLKVIATPVTESPPSPVASSISPNATNLVEEFINAHKELQSYKSGRPVVLDGHTLSIAAVAAAARYDAGVELDDSPLVKDRLLQSRQVVADKVEQGTSIYGVTTGFGGSADTRTDQPILLGNALMQMQHSGILPSSSKPLDALPLQDPFGLAMPESWVRGAMLIRMNSLIRGHSGVRWELIEKMNDLLRANITPVVPLRGSISASGDLQPLSYVAGALYGNPSIRVFDGERTSALGPRKIVSSVEALEAHSISPISLACKEHLGILNGTAFSASVAALALHDAVHLTLLTQVLTAMGTEALAGTRGNFDPFIHAVARPHPGQIETADVIWNLLEGSKFATTEEEEMTIDEDKGHLRQDRYPLRTSPQFIGPQVEDLIASLATITLECNSTTDNPLVDGETGKVHNGGNFQAMAVTNAMEKTRLSLHHLGKLVFSQCAELINPTMNRGLPPSLAATDPSLNYHAKGIDIASAAYVAELGYLANPVSTHIQSAEMHNQAINSMALVSGRATITSLEVLSLLISSYLYAICQALDLRALQHELYEGLDAIVKEEIIAAFSPFLDDYEITRFTAISCHIVRDAMDSTSTMDAKDRMTSVAASLTTPLVDFLTGEAFSDVVSAGQALTTIPAFRARIAARGYELLDELRRAYLSGGRGLAPASRFLNKTRPVYEFVRLTLGIKMHGAENYNDFENGVGVDDVTTGQNVSLIHEAIRDGKLQPIIVDLF
ncbi:hypothetical protein PLEOSDRAFT_1112899 [Pleurotus ostreatus PC15]|uniref:Phenylalanine ammonia-lyase n=1 Tax=Pleurotus ostreatus (strain PC15) TaxID=1137138 RepID=A0A067NMD6_PLEO1|nr:hypothetical protein PLEOSDRAFT_1112899 [Pleurotus ostreatus PC15]